jgi:hypothetical protein
MAAAEVMDNQEVGLTGPEHRCRKVAGSGSYPFEQIGPERVVYHVRNQTNRWPDENATYRARLGNADASSAYDANGRKG